MAVYTDLADMRAVDGVGSSTEFPDAEVTAAIAYATSLINRATGTDFGDKDSPSYASFSLTLNGSGTSWLVLTTERGDPLLFPRSISSATIGGVADSGVSYTLHPTGAVWRDTGVWSSTPGGLNVVVNGTAGYSDDPPEDIKWAARMITRDRLLHDTGRNPGRALQLTTPDGSFQMNAQPGKPGRYTALPDVNAVLNDYRQVW